MMHRMAASIAIVALALSVLLSVGALIFAVLDRFALPQLINELIGPTAAIAFGVVGALIAVRRPRNPIGWIFSFMSVTQGLVSFAYNYALYTLVIAPGALPFGPLMSWIGQLLWFPGLCLMLTYGLLLFPDGRLPSRRWRFVGWICLLPQILFAVGAVVVWPERGRAFLYDSVDQQPQGLVFLIDLLMFPLLLGCALACVVSLIVRFRRSHGVERQQLKWFTFAAAITLFTLWFSETFRLGIVSTLLVLLVVPSLPAATGIAILRYRLFNIDLIIRRTLIYSVLTATLALIYMGSILVLQTLLRPLIGAESELATVASTLTIAALFQPLRRRIQTVIDRRFYRRKYDAQQTLAAFSARLREETDLAHLSSDLIAVVQETLQPAHVSLWLREPEVKR